MESAQGKALATVGDATTLAIVTIQNDENISTECLLVGIGSQIWGFALPQCSHLFTQTVLPNAARIQGITQIIGTQVDLTYASSWIAVYGDRYVALAQVGLSALTSLAVLPRLPHWTLCVTLVPHSWIVRTTSSDDEITQTSASSWIKVLIVIGLSDNSVAVYHATLCNGSVHEAPEFAFRVECVDSRCLLYSMDIHVPVVRKQESVSIDFEGQHAVRTVTARGLALVAAGTVFLDVVIWPLKLNMDLPSMMEGVLYRLKGHQGSIHSILWASSGLTLVSGSDDRTLQVWDVPAEAIFLNGDNDHEIVLNPRHVLFGHTGRIWRSCFSENNENMVVSGSEDGTCRVWNVTKDRGDCVASINAHRFRGVWDCLVRGTILLTAGADGACKAWNLWDWIAPKDLQDIQDGDVNIHSRRPWEMFRLQRSLPDPLATVPLDTADTVDTLEEADVSRLNPMYGAKGRAPSDKFDSKAEWIRCMALHDDGTLLFIGTNLGFIHQVQLPERGKGMPERWKTVYVSSHRRAISTLVVQEAVEEKDAFEGAQKSKYHHIVGSCDLEGRAIVVHCTEGEETNVIEWTPDEMTGKALGLFFAPEVVPGSNVVLAGIDGNLGIWEISAAETHAGNAFSSDAPEQRTLPRALASGRCPSGSRVISVTLKAWAEASSEHQTSWLMFTGSSSGGVTLWCLAMGRYPASDWMLTVLDCIRDAHVGTPVKSVSSRWVPIMVEEPEMVENRIELESAGGNSAMMIYTVDKQRQRLVRLGETRYESSLLVVIGKCRGRHSVSGSVWTTKEGNSSTGDLVFGFRGPKFSVWNKDADAEVCSVQCGSWRRPWAVAVPNPNDITFCFDCGSRQIAVYRRRGKYDKPASTENHWLSGNSLPKALMSRFHGRELNAVKAVCWGGQVVCFTGGEDAMVGVACFDPTWMPHLSFVGDHAGGTAVKALSIVDLAGRSRSLNMGRQLLISAGSKRVIMAWTLRPKPTDEYRLTRPPFETEWLSTHASPAVIRRRSAPQGRPGEGIDLRYVALRAFTYSNRSPHCSVSNVYVVASCSNGIIEILLLSPDPAKCQSNPCQSWPLIARLEMEVNARAPALSVQCIQLDDIHSSNARHIVFTGGTDGTVGIWDITTAMRAFEAWAASSSIAQEKGFSTGEASLLGWEPRTLRPIHVIDGVHQSGINGLSVNLMDGETGRPSSGASDGKPLYRVVLVTAGDDQAISVLLLELSTKDSPSNEIDGDQRSPMCSADVACREVHKTTEQNAHASAVRDVWSDGKIAFSVGLDQRIRRWKLGFQAQDVTNVNDALKAPGAFDESYAIGMSIREVGLVASQVLEPAALDVVRLGVGRVVGEAQGNGDIALRERPAVVVAGRGLQVVQF